jgi:hypothetical protein
LKDGRCTMPPKQKINFQKVRAALKMVCPHCSCSIPPAEIRQVDFDLMECPKCKELFIPSRNRIRL